MPLLTVKLSESLHRKLEKEARNRKVSKSDILRHALENAFERNSRGTLFENIDDLLGAGVGPRDLSVNKKYLKNYGKARKSSR